MSSAKRWLFGLELNVLQLQFVVSVLQVSFGPLKANKGNEGLSSNVSIKDRRPDV